MHYALQEWRRLCYCGRLIHNNREQSEMVIRTNVESTVSLKNATDLLQVVSDNHRASADKLQLPQDM